MNNYANSRWKERGSFNKDTLHSYQDIIDAIRTAPYGIDTREAMAQMLMFLYSTVQSIGDNFSIDMSPTDTFENVTKLKEKYPNGQQGVFVVQDTGHWYFWSELENVWKDGGSYQTPAPIDDIRKVDAKADSNKKQLDALLADFEAVDAKASSNKKRLNDLLADFANEVLERKKIDADLIDKLASYLTALELKEVRLRDEQSQLLWDGNNYVTGNVYLPKTDRTGLEEGVPVDSSIIGYTFLGHLEEYGLPILKLESPDLLNLTSKEQGKLKGVKFEYNPNGNEGVRLSGTLKSIKIQGNGSAIYPKKNYTLAFNDDVCFKGLWGNHDKYVIKADWTDFSHIRNEFGAWLWGQIRKTLINAERDVFVKTTTSNLVNENGDILVGETSRQFLGPNFGAIDSYPVLVIINGIYHGLYSMCVPKDDWMANMGYGTKEAIISADGQMNYTTRFKELDRVDKKGNLTGEGFGIEYVSDEKNQSWVAESINTLITNVINAKGSVDGIKDYIDIDSVHDYLIMNVLIGNVDAYIRNFILDTWDGIKWYIAPYDMDSVLGNFWHGKTMTNIETTDFNSVDSTNRLFHLVYKYDKDKFLKRWNYLRNSILSDNNLYVALANFANKIPQAVLNYEEKLWPGRPSSRISNINQIQNWLIMRLKYLDRKITEITEES